MDNVTAVKEKSDIVDFIKGYVPLKKAGTNYKGNCPFHKEKTPSFMVNPDLQIYKCFGCGKSGDILSFAMEIEGLEFYDSLKLLADKYGVQLKQNEKIDRATKAKSKIFEINNIAADFYSAVLLKHEAGKEALSYLKNRKMKTTTIKEFRMGYAPNVWSSVSKLLLKKGYSEDEIVLAGLAKKRKNGGIYDVYRNRVMFPLISPAGKVVGFAGRALSKDTNPKYMNTPQTAVFHKDAFLFGLNLSKIDIKKEGVAIIAEGIFDMISPFQAGFRNIVASQGTALTKGQITLIERYADSIILLFDNDVAGISATLRGIDLIEESSLEVKVATMPEGFKDPDDLAMENPDLLKESIEKAVFIGDFYMSYVKRFFDMSNVYQKSKAVDFLSIKLKGMKDDVIRGEYLKKYAIFLDISEAMLSKRLNAVSGDRKVEKESKSVLKEKGTDSVEKVFPVGESYLISLLIKSDDELFKEALGLINMKLFSDKDLAKVFDIIKTFRSKNVSEDENFNLKALYDRLRTVIGSEKLLNSFFLTEFENSSSDSTFIRTELLSSADRLRKNYLQRRLNFLSREIKKAEILSDFDKVSVLKVEFFKITKELS